MPRVPSEFIELDAAPGRARVAVSAAPLHSATWRTAPRVSPSVAQWTAPFLLTIVVLVGCSPAQRRDSVASSNAPTNGTNEFSANELSPNEFIVRLWAARCREAVRCPPPHGSTTSHTAAPSRIAYWCHPATQWASPAVALGSTCDPADWLVLPELARRCLAAWEDGCESDFRPDRGLCSHVFARPPGRVDHCWARGCPVGERCYSSGRCAEPRDVGEPCTPSLDLAAECADGLVCDPAAGRCTRFVSRGAGCGVGQYCRPPAVCMDGRCQDFGATDEPCVFEHGCADGNACITHGDTARCVVLGRAGERCTSCDGAADCLAPCGPGLRCMDGSCAPAILPGGACMVGAECPDAFRCESGRCVANPVDGQRCDAAVPCARGRCISGRCRALMSGEPCDPDAAPLGECAASLNCEPLDDLSATGIRYECRNDTSPNSPGCSCDGYCVW